MIDEMAFSKFISGAVKENNFFLGGGGGKVF
jgi:hypothetical protein